MYNSNYFFKKLLPIVFLGIQFISGLSCNNNDKTNSTVVAKLSDSIKIVETVIPPLPDSTIAKMKTIYITCDDGPNFGSSVVMNVAKEENIPVTFFVVGFQYTGQTGKIFANTWQRMHTQPGIEVCNHSFTHAFNDHYERYYATPTGVVDDFKRAADSGHFANTISRTPGNNMWRTPTITHSTYKRYIPAVDSLHNAGFTLFGWDWEWFHHKMVLKQTPEQMFATIKEMMDKKRTFTPNHFVLLSHDQSFADAHDSAWFHQFVKIVKSNPNYRFDVVSHYPGVLKK